LVNDLLLPLARGLTANWNDGSRREAGIVLAHITGSGSEATHIVQAMARQLKKVSNVIIVPQVASGLVLSNVFSVSLRSILFVSWRRKWRVFDFPLRNG
jgi:ABC-type Fe2+-enterobactin transport system substrate-binding protein